MSEWGVVGVIVVLLGLVCTIIAPIIKLNSNITRMTVVLDKLEISHAEDMRKNTDSHRRIWEHNNEQDEKINDHEKRIHILEHN